MSEPFRLAAEKEQSLTVYTNRHVFAVDMQDGKTIGAVRAVDTLTGAITTYRGRMFIDCTGDGWVGFYAGAELRKGREARSEFGESLAPEQADEITMSGCSRATRCHSARWTRASPRLHPRRGRPVPRPRSSACSIRYFTGVSELGTRRDRRHLPGRGSR